VWTSKAWYVPAERVVTSPRAPGRPPPQLQLNSPWKIHGSVGFPTIGFTSDFEHLHHGGLCALIPRLLSSARLLVAGFAGATVLYTYTYAPTATRSVCRRPIRPTCCSSAKLDCARHSETIISDLRESKVHLVARLHAQAGDQRYTTPRLSRALTPCNSCRAEFAPRQRHITLARFGIFPTAILRNTFSV